MLLFQAFQFRQWIFRVLLVQFWFFFFFSPWPSANFATVKRALKGDSFSLHLHSIMLRDQGSGRTEVGVLDIEILFFFWWGSLSWSRGSRQPNAGCEAERGLLSAILGFLMRKLLSLSKNPCRLHTAVTVFFWGKHF